MTQLDSSLAARARAWRAADPDPETRAQLDRLLDGGDGAALAERFDGSLAFGTAGLRAELGAGPLRMNRLVVGRVAAGLARYIAAHDPAALGTGPETRTEPETRTGPGGGGDAGAGVVVGYDGRACSDVFAKDAARILSRSGVRVWLLPGALPTPVLAFTVPHVRAAYGLMVTASHNPREYNGIKVYVRDGGQLQAPLDSEIAAAIDAVDPLRLPAGWAEGPFEFTPADDSVDAYVAAVAGRAGPPPPPSPSPPPAPLPAPPPATPPSPAPGAGGPGAGGTPLKVVYTALHGVGDETFQRVLAAAGWPAPLPVAAQRRPDPGFPTVPYPNPEEPGVLDLAKEEAERAGADLVLAHDPDADRLAVMVQDAGGWRALTGDELGALLGDAVLTGLHGRSASARSRRPVVATTVVSGSLLRAMSLAPQARAAGVACVTTLTGFKWIARAGGRDGDLVYGYEQAIGYAVRPDLVADKDGISAAAAVLRLANLEARRGRTLLDRLDDLARAHGVHVTGQRTLRPPAGQTGQTGRAGLALLADAVDRVRKEPPRLLAGQPVTVADLLDDAPGVVDLAGGHAERSPGVPVPPADVLIWHAGEHARVMIRPSGTEPVLKIYAEAVRPAGPTRPGEVGTGPGEQTDVRWKEEVAAARTEAGVRLDELLAAAVAALHVNW